MLNQFPNQIMARLIGWCLLVVGCPLHGIAENVFDDFEDVPIISGEPLETVHATLLEGADDIRRILLLGDSQETSPGGAGSVYIPHLQFLLKSRFGYVGETPFYGFSSIGSGQPPAGWLVGVSNGSMGPERFTDSSLPPGLTGSLNRLPQNGSAQELGTFFTLLHDASLTRDSSLGNEVVMDPTSSIVAEILIRQSEGNPGARYFQRPTNNYNAWSPATQAGSFEVLDIDSASGFSIGQSSQLNRNGATYHRVEIFGDSVEVPTEILAGRFVDLNNRTGILIQAFSQGGYSSNSLESLHGKSGGVLKAVKSHLAMVQYGANDLLEVDPAGFQERLHLLIDFIRDAVDDPCLQIVLVGDGWRELPPELYSRQDKFPAAAANVANSRECVTAINMRRVMEDMYPYWGEGIRSHVYDGVHLTLEAQADVAEAVADIILPPVGSICLGDFNGDRIVNGADLGLLIGDWGVGKSDFDMNQDGNINGADIGIFLGTWGECQP